MSTQKKMMMLRIKKHEIDLASRLLREINEERIANNLDVITKSELLHYAIEAGLQNVEVGKVIERQD